MLHGLDFSSVPWEQSCWWKDETNIKNPSIDTRPKNFYKEIELHFVQYSGLVLQDGIQIKHTEIAQVADSDHNIIMPLYEMLSFLAVGCV